MKSLAYPGLGQVYVQGWRDTMTVEALFRALQGAPIQRHDRPAGNNRFDQRPYVTADPGDTGHFGQFFPVEPERERIRQLRRA